MDLSTRYLGLSLANPFVAGASPQSDSVDTVVQLEAAGASAIIMHSLFEEQINRSGNASELYASAATCFPNENAFVLTPETYLQHLKRLKSSVAIPIIGSLNGVTPSGWVRYAEFIEGCGADALELNVYSVSSDADDSANEVERRLLNLVAAVRSAIKIPLSIKLVPFYSALPNLARRIADEGADGLVLFNRSYYPLVDVEDLTLTSLPELSGPWELPLRLRWVGILFQKVNAALSITGGIHSVDDAVKSILAGADTIQLVSVLLKHGPEYLKELIAGFDLWMTRRKFQSLDECRGLLSLKNCPDAADYERGTYALGLQGWNERKKVTRPPSPRL